MVRAHRQAWVWQDEWIGLTMKDIRRLERETQIILRKKLGKVVSDDEEADGDAEDSGDEEVTLTSSTINAVSKNKPLSSGNGNVVTGSDNTTKLVSHLDSSPIPATEQLSEKLTEQTKTLTVANTSRSTETGDSHESIGEHNVTMRYSIDAGELAERRLSKKSASLRHRSLKRNSRQSKRQASLPDTKLDVHAVSNSSILARRRASSTDSDYLPCYGLDAVAMMNISSDDEYYDALGKVFNQSLLYDQMSLIVIVISQCVTC